MMLGNARNLTVLALLVASQSLLTKSAQADEPPAQPARATAAPADPHAAPVTPPDPAVAAKQDIVPAKAVEREVSLEPKISEAAPTGRMTFDIDPIADSGIIAVSLGFAGTLELINSTGEIRPQQIRTPFNRSNLFFIDRAVIAQTPDHQAATNSTIGLGAALAFAVIDPILSGVREKSVQTGLADAFMYAESISLTMAMTNIVKMAVRRPRPIAYIEAEANQKDMKPVDNNSTDSALSFFSGHAAITATVSATASYLAFARAPRTARPWITLGVGTALTTFVSIERVRAGKHFPTDVIAGTIAGAGIGLLVPHLHRTDDIKQRRIWVGYAPASDGARGGLLDVSGTF